MNYVMGYGHGIETMGEEILGDDWPTVGAFPSASEVMRAPAGSQAAWQSFRQRPQSAAAAYTRHPQARPPGAAPMSNLALPPPPDWRPAISPGVAMPGEGMEPLPMTPLQGGGVFLPALTTITWQAQPQAPFRGERLLASVRRSVGAGGVTILGSGVFVGRQLQQVQLGEWDVEFFTSAAFGVRLQFVSSVPGMLIQLQARTSIAVPAGESLSVSFVILGRTIR